MIGRGGGGLVREAVKQPIICTKRLCAKVENWGAKVPLGPPVLPPLCCSYGPQTLVVLKERGRRIW